MKYTNLNSEKDYITAYQNKGYTQNYRSVNNMLIDLEHKTEYKPEAVSIVAEHRFEGISNPGDMSILYVIETKDNRKGTALVNYGPSHATELATFFNAIPEDNISQKANILDYKG